jgi:hypothetical protein
VKGHATPIEYWRWELAERFGWPLEYVDGLSVEDMHEFWQIDDGRNRVMSEQRARAIAKCRKR